MKAKLQEAMKVAMKAKEREKLQTIRSVLSAIQYLEMEEGDLDDKAIIGVLKSELKKRQEEQEFAQKAGRLEQLPVLEEEIATIRLFLPKQISSETIKEFIATTYPDTSGINIGVVIKSLNEAFPGQVDGKMASQIIKDALSST
jgi:uncharacterized protein